MIIGSLNMNKKAFNLFFISLLFLFLVSSVSATDIDNNNITIQEIKYNF